MEDGIPQKFNWDVVTGSTGDYNFYFDFTSNNHTNKILDGYRKEKSKQNPVKDTRNKRVAFLVANTKTF